MHQRGTKRLTLPNVISLLSLQRRRVSNSRHRSTAPRTTKSHDKPVLVNMPSTVTAGKPLDILCFGDSLTSGYYDYGAGSRPYSTVLAARLKAAFPGTVVNVYTNGHPGDVASFPAFQQRLKNECKFYSMVTFCAGQCLYLSFPTLYTSRSLWILVMNVVGYIDMDNFTSLSYRNI